MSKPQIVKRLEKKFLTANIKADTLDAIKWFRKMATKVGSDRVIRKKVVDGYEHVKEIKQGEMYCFMYDPKHKDTLPVYDRFPLIFAIERYKDGLLGLNIHFLPPKLRQMVLLQFAGTTAFSEHQAKKLNWKISKAILNDKHLKRMVKRYLWTHLQSPMAIVPPEDWPIMVFLPTASFEKQSKKEVWSGL